MILHSHYFFISLAAHLHSQLHVFFLGGRGIVCDSMYSPVSSLHVHMSVQLSNAGAWKTYQWTYPQNMYMFAYIYIYTIHF